MSGALEIFEAQRPKLTSLAYHMLGEIQAAEDIVQEAWLRWNKSELASVQSPAAWLSSVVTRLSIDQLRSARHRREVYKGPWLPEPIVDTGASPQRALELARECELALLWSMERLTEEERAAFILTQVFETPYASVARQLQRSEQSCRQLVSRARKRLAEESPRFETSSEDLQAAMYKFAEAASAGNHQAVMEMLAPDVVAIADGGGLVTAALIPLEGPERVAQVLVHVARQRELASNVVPVLVNGLPALMQYRGDDGDMIFTLRLNAAGKICWIYTLRNPNKLAAALQDIS